jgi:hypothetical protein
MGQPIMPKRKVPTTTPLQEVMEPSYGESPKVATRAETRRNSAIDVNLTNVDEVMGSLFEVLGSTNISAPSPNVTPLEIDTLSAELIAVRNAKDIVEGRESALKAYATEVINMRIAHEGKDYTTESGYLVSPENGIKLSKEVSGGKLNIDIDLLKQKLDADQFSSITNEIGINKVVKYPDGKTETTYSLEYELNEEALEKELKIGNIGMEQIVQAAIPGKVRSAFYVRSL